MRKGVWCTGNLFRLLCLVAFFVSLLCPTALARLQKDIVYSCRLTESSGEGDTAECTYNNTVTTITISLDNLEVGSSAWWLTLVICIVLVLIAGLMSGMTIGLMSLDLMHLKILKESGSETEKKYCTKIIPLVSQHHLLLVTLLLANAAAMESLPIFLDRLVPAYLAIILSVTFILFFGEVIPQAICSKYGLAIGYYIHWLMWALIGICFIVAYPVAKLLDCILGEDKLNFYRADEIKSLVKLHKLEEQNGESGGTLSNDEVRIIQGALNMRTKVCDASVYTSLEKVYALPLDASLTRSLFQEIHSKGHSRIPVYRKKKTQIIGVLLVKDLIVINPDDGIKLDSLDLVMIPQAFSNTPLYDLMNNFRKGKSHMAVVIDPADFTTVLGIVTLEDIIEELLALEILDEGDVRNKTSNSEDRQVRISIDNGPGTVVSIPVRPVGSARPSINLTRDPHTIPKDVGYSIGKPYITKQPKDTIVPLEGEKSSDVQLSSSSSSDSSTSE